MKKDVFQVVLLIVMFIIVGYRMYTKYFRKGGESTSQDLKERSKLPSSTRDDDYEPYQKK